MNVPNYFTITELDETTTGEPCYMARHPELPGVLGSGLTPERARESLREATAMVLEDMRASNMHPPASRSWPTGHTRLEKLDQSPLCDMWCCEAPNIVQVSKAPELTLLS